VNQEKGRFQAITGQANSNFGTINIEPHQFRFCRITCSFIGHAVGALNDQ
jgi:hypothetical protein